MRFGGRGVRTAVIGIWLLLAVGAGGCSDCSLEVTTTSLPDGTVGDRYFAELNSDCGGDFWYLQTGQLPPGIGLQDNGDVEGMPTTAGSFQFVVAVIDFPSGDQAFKGLAITVDPAP